MARQSGKSEVVATTLAGCMILLPDPGQDLPDPGALQARACGSASSLPLMTSPTWCIQRIVDPSDVRSGRGHALGPRDRRAGRRPRAKLAKLSQWLASAAVRPPTRGPRSKGSTYHIIVIDEAQDADETVIRKSIHPMLASTGGSMVKIGTPGYHKGDFYKAINLNKRRANVATAPNHFEYDYRVVCKYNPAYKKFVEKEKLPSR